MSQTRWIFCSGMPRSGSTWAYNATKLLVARRDDGRVVALYADTPDLVDEALIAPRRDGTTVVLKFHKASDRVFDMLATGAALNVYTYRHPLQAIASWLEIFGFNLDGAIEVMRESLRNMDRYRELPGTLLVSMEEIVVDARTATARLAHHLHIRLADPALRDIASRTSIARMAEIARSLEHWPDAALVDAGHSRYDPETHLHIGHITQGLARDYRTTLSAEDEARCSDAFAPWRAIFERWR
jgi:hypothetical protein